MTTSGPSSRPDISVVIASVNGLPYPMACLDALAGQEGGLASEVIVADCTGAATVAAIKEHHPEVRVLAFDEQKSVPWLRSAGAGAATGRLLAITEDHCVPRSDWLASMADAVSRTGWAAVGGGVENGSRRRLVDWAVYFCEYSQLMSPVTGGPSDVLPGMNVAYDMDALAPVRDVFLKGAWEHVVHDEIRHAGFRLGLDPGIVVSHLKYFTVPMFTRERYHYSRAYAGARVAGSALHRRLAWAGAAALLPPLLVWRVSNNVVRRRKDLAWYARALPLVVFFSVVWSVGEAVGYLTGPGDSLVKIR